MVLIIDNYDSFVYNLAQIVEGFRKKVRVLRNDKIALRGIKNLSPSHIIISPGPGIPGNAGISCDVVSEFYENIPILGVCLGHQCIGEVFGAKIIRSTTLMHGKVSAIFHNQKNIFSKVKLPFMATRYHSLILDKETIPACLEVNAWTKDGVVMGIKHRQFKVFGVQFHPESVLTKFGKQLLHNFIEEV